MSHLGGAYPEGDSNTFMPDVWGYLLVKYEIKSVLDVGCGYGHALKWFSDVGCCQIKGIEGWDEAVKNNLVPQAIVQHDFITGSAPVAQPFDLIWSAEFLEHVDAKHIPDFMTAFRMGRYACVTHAEPGQAGFNHVNCQTTEYWIEKFKQYGLEYDPEETALLRRTDRWRAGWGRRTLAFFKRMR